jgi:Matrixin
MKLKYFFSTFAVLSVAIGVMGIPIQAKAATVTGAKWGASQIPGTSGGVVTYSFMPTGPSCTAERDSCSNSTITALASFMPAGFKAEIKKAFDAWAAVANIQFQEVSDSDTAFNASGAKGDIRIGGHYFDGVNNVLAHGYFPQSGAPSYAGDVHFDTSETWKIGFGGSGFDIFTVAAHEIGHAIGLDHTDVAGSLMEPYYSESFYGLQADDITGAQLIYGSATAVPSPSLLAPMIGFGVVAFRKRKAVKA